MRNDKLNLLYQTILENYTQVKYEILQSYYSFFSEKANIYFFENWCRHHEQLFHTMKLEDFDHFDEVNRIFMHKRSRMASGFMQGLKSSGFPSSVLILKEILKIHDEKFKALLAVVLKYYSEELVKAQRFRKVQAAYVQSHGV